jgi:hypothetical protein
MTQPSKEERQEIGSAELDILESTAKAATPGKSLGEKLFDANATLTGTGFRWRDLHATTQTDHEKVGLHFAASLSHDETATAVIADLEGKLQAAETEVERLHGLVEVAVLQNRDFSLASEARFNTFRDRATTAEALVASLRQELSERAPFSKEEVRAISLDLEAEAERAKTRQLEVRRLSSALVDISVRVGTPGEIVNASQRGQALADVRRMADEALDNAPSDTREQSQ